MALLEPVPVGGEEEVVASLAEYRDARDKLGAQGAGWKWHNRTNKLWIASILFAGTLVTDIMGPA